MLLMPVLMIVGALIGPVVLILTVRALIVMPRRQKRQIALLESIDRSLQMLPAVREKRAAQASRGSSPRGT